MRGDLVLNQLAIAARRPCRNVAAGFPHIDTAAHEPGDRRLARPDVASLPHACEQRCEFEMGFALGAAKRDVLGLALARDIGSGIELEPPRMLAASGDVAAHL